jgi:hypothetical protein
LGNTTLGRPWIAIISQPAYLVALFGPATGYGVMILAMTATPLAMVHHHHDLSTAATVIQLHARDVSSILLHRIAGRALRCPACHADGSSPPCGTRGDYSDRSRFWLFRGRAYPARCGLEFLYVGGTTLLTGTYTAVERGRAQATNDMTIFAVGLVCSFSAAALLQSFGWQLLNMLLLPWLLLTAASVAWLGYSRRARPQPAE